MLDHGSSDLVARARALAVALRERVPLTRSLRRVPDETIEDLHEAGFFRMLQPTARGGLQADPHTFYEVQIALAAGCPSTAWVMSVLAVHAWQLALFEPQAQADVWDADERALISSSYAPTGKVERVEGGYRISGRWSFSSGCDHCGWVFLGGLVPPRSDGESPQMRTFLVPRTDWVVEDTWQVAGLVGTGSNDIVVEGAFVPEHRTHKLIDGFTTKNPGGHTAPLYRLPFGQIFVRSVSTSVIGCLEGALEAYLDVGRKKLAASTGKRVAADPVAQMACAEARATLDEVKLVLHRSFDELLDHIDRDEPIPLERRVQFRYESARAVNRCTQAIDGLFTASGGRSLFLDAEIQRFFQDAHAIRAHFANKPEGPGRNLGSVLLGLENTDLFL
ncbi:MAG: flavin-dependent monooxygenase [Proteobacteria bacterium]|nr:flavin-dependent monooxygenase [Pseudomonadota bacterium]MCP4922065.1 flavin-dependent monooxygenase [Pseudomonadota bacterium]